MNFDPWAREFLEQRSERNETCLFPPESACGANKLKQG